MPTGGVCAVDHALRDFGIDWAPDPVRGGEASIDFAGAVPVVGDAPLALFLSDVGHGGRVGPGEDDLRAGIEERRSSFFLDDRIVPGVDPAHIHRALRAGPLHTQRNGVAQPNLFGDGEGCHVTQLGVAIHLGPRPGEHSGQVLHVFHRTHQVAEVGGVGLDAGEVDVHNIGELFSHDFHRVHVAKGRAEDEVETLAGEAAEDLLGLGAFRDIFDVGNVDVWDILCDVLQPFEVGLAPSAVIVRTNEHHRNVELASFGRRNGEATLFRLPWAASTQHQCQDHH